MLICPACNKKSEARPGACGRCGCDLTKLVEITQAARRQESLAALALRTGNFKQAVRHAEASWRLVHSEESIRLGGLAAIAAKDVRGILAWQARGEG